MCLEVGASLLGSSLPSRVRGTARRARTEPFALKGSSAGS